MKEILSNQYDQVSGGWQDMDGSGIKSSSNGGSSYGSNGGASLSDRFTSAYYNNPYGSGAGASGYWGNSSSNRTNSLSGIPGAPNAGGNGR